MTVENLQECDLGHFNSLVYAATQAGKPNPSAWAIDALMGFGVELVTARQDDNSVTLIRSKGYTVDVHHKILDSLDGDISNAQIVEIQDSMPPEVAQEAFDILLANAYSVGKSKEWVIENLIDAGAKVTAADELDLNAACITHIENLIEEIKPTEQLPVSSEADLQQLYSTLEARAELAGLSAEALSENHAAISPDYELTDFVIRELTKQVEQWENAFGPGSNYTLAAKPEEVEQDIKCDVCGNVDQRACPKCNNPEPASIVDSAGDQESTEKKTIKMKCDRCKCVYFSNGKPCPSCHGTSCRPALSYEQEQALELEAIEKAKAAQGEPPKTKKGRRKKTAANRLLGVIAELKIILEQLDGEGDSDAD